MPVFALGIVPSPEATGGGCEAVVEATLAAAAAAAAALLPLAGGRLPRPQMEKSKSSALYSRLCFSKYCRNSLRERNFRPSGLFRNTSKLLIWRGFLLCWKSNIPNNVNIPFSRGGPALALADLAGPALRQVGVLVHGTPMCAGRAG